MKGRGCRSGGGGGTEVKWKRLHRVSDKIQPARSENSASSVSLARALSLFLPRAHTRPITLLPARRCMFFPREPFLRYPRRSLTAARFSRPAGESAPERRVSPRFSFSLSLSRTRDAAISSPRIERGRRDTGGSARLLETRLAVSRVMSDKYLLAE